MIFKCIKLQQNVLNAELYNAKNTELYNQGMYLFFFLDCVLPSKYIIFCKFLCVHKNKYNIK